MRSIVLYLLVLCLHVSARGQQPRVTMHFTNVPVARVFTELSKQTGMSIIYKEEILKDIRPVTVHVKQASVEEVLQASFKDQPLSYKIINNNILVQFKKAASVPDSTGNLRPVRTISGTVQDENGHPLAGAAVTVSGSTNGISTDAQGYFSLKVQEEDNLVVTMVGYKTYLYQADDQHVQMTIQLKPEASALQEMVVVGYGSQKRENLTGAIATVKGNLLQSRPTPSPANLLQGLVAGLTVSMQGSYPGASSTLKIRETATWAGNADPLYVLDGFVRDAAAFAALNPADIDNISILKDASPAAIYGIKGGNGVILVTTKQGMAGKPRVVYQASYTIQAREVVPRMMNAFENYSFFNSINRQLGMSPADPGYYSQDELDYFATHSYNWVEAIWINPWNTNHHLSIAGGSKDLRYYVSGGYLYQQGAVANNYNKYNLLAKMDGQLTTQLSFNLTMSALWENGSRPYWAYDGGDMNLVNMYARLLTATPGRPPYINGYPVANFDNTNTAQLARGEGGYIKPVVNRYTPSFQLKYDVPQVKGLSVKGIFSYNTTNSYTKSWRQAPYIYYFRTTGTHNHILTDAFDEAMAGGFKVIDQAQTTGAGAPTALQENYLTTSNYQLNLMLSYERAFGDHQLSATGGFEQSASKGHQSSVRINNFSNTDYQQASGGSRNPLDWSITGDNLQATAFQSWLGRFSYHYQSRYMLGFTLRADGSYVFPPHKRWGLFPSVSLAWNIAREPFFKSLAKPVDLLKLRFSYGITGSDNTAPWQWQPYYGFNTSSGQYIGNSMPPSISLASPANPNITWEKNRSYDVGLDLGAFNKLIGFSIDAWYKKTTDILGIRNSSIPNTVGANLPAVNYGIASAKGIELSVTHENRIGQVTYTAGIRWAISTNQYILVDQAANVRDYQDKLGKPINGQITGYICEGIIRSQAEVDAILAKNGKNFTLLGNTPRPGMLLYKDIRGPQGSDTPDGIVDGHDITTLSYDGVPRCNYGFELAMNWNGFQFTAIFSGLGKYQIMPSDFFYRQPMNYLNNFATWKQAWTPETAATASLPSAAMNSLNGISNTEQPSSFWLINGAFLRLRSLVVNYHIPRQWLTKNLLQSINFYFSGDNLYQWRHNKDFDPELTNWAVYPVLKSFTFGVNCTL